MFIFANLLLAIAKILDILLTVYMWIVIIRALISWVNPDPYNPIVRFLHAVTDPVLNPIRRIIGYRLGPIEITPLDIQQKQFPMKFRGFDVEEVYAFLEVIRKEMEDLLRENASLKESAQRAENQIKEYKDMETTLRETLM